MSTRSAEDTIKGYFYQFDYSILKLLELKNNSDSLTVEGIEDVDIDTGGLTKAIQCKYYAKTEYNHSVISEPIRLMLQHFAKAVQGKATKIKYHLYGHYKDGHSKLSLPLSLDDLKNNFLTFTKNKIKRNLQTELALNDQDLKKFLQQLTIDINAKEYDNQLNEIFTKLKSEFSCSYFEAEFYFYNNAINEIKRLAIQSTPAKRKIKKGEFLKRINNKKILFNKWFVERKGLTAYHKKIKSEHFSKYNKADYERFFVLDISDSPTVQTLKEICYHISHKFSNIKRREPLTFCPYILLANTNSADLTTLKTELWDEGFYFRDGFPHLGSNFSSKHILTRATYENQLKLKFVQNFSQLETLLSEITKTKEVYYFFKPTSKINLKSSVSKLVEIEITDIEHIKSII